MRAAPRLTPGRAVYLLYHYPLAQIRRSLHEGGPWQQQLDHRGREQMRRAAWELPPPSFPETEPSLELHLLTGEAFAFQSLFCLWTFSQTSRRHLKPVFYDDGTLTPSLIARCRHVFPAARFVFHDETSARVEKHLPASKFPFLRNRFERDPLLQKLIAPHLNSTGWKLMLDSDLLFLRRPEFLLAWLASSNLPLHMIDVAESYGYPRPLLEKLANGPLPEKLNSGLTGLRSEALDWEKLEWWCSHLIRAAGTHYLLEQALTALLFSGQERTLAPASDYLTFPTPEEIASPRAVMHHYVADSKRGYFREAWRHSLTEFLSATPVFVPTT